MENEFKILFSNNLEIMHNYKRKYFIEINK